MSAHGHGVKDIAIVLGPPISTTQSTAGPPKPIAQQIWLTYNLRLNNSGGSGSHDEWNERISGRQNEVCRLGCGDPYLVVGVCGDGSISSAPSRRKHSRPVNDRRDEPTLVGGVIRDTLVPFSIKSAAGEVLCSGQLQDRVVRSTRTGRVDFYYRIRNTQGPGAVRGIATAAYGGLPLRVGYRLDGLGTVPPRIATRSPAAGALVTFEITDPPVSCAQHQETRFILIRTPVQAFHSGGKTQIIATTGDEVSVPTVMPYRQLQVRPP
jgi:hypothetical protein